MSSGGRETSGKSFFSRSKHKVVPFSSAVPKTSDTYPPSGVDDAASSKSSARSTRSRHSISSHKEQQNRDTVYGDELNINSMAGVVSSIPYDSVAPDLNRQPIPVDYPRPVSRGDDGREREITPHSIARLGDFHQYPNVDPQPQHYSHPTGPRPPPSSSGSSTLTANSYYAPGREYSAPNTPTPWKNANGSQMYCPSNSTTASSNTRSSDQMSVHSSISSTTRSSMVSVAPTVMDIPPMQFPVQSASMTEFSMERPRDDYVVEKMFFELMERRGYSNLPEPAKRQLMAKPVSGKWTMIYQDKLADWQAEQKRRAAALSSGKDADEDSPQWYVKKIMEGNITAKQLASLSVSLRTQPIG